MGYTKDGTNTWSIWANIHSFGSGGYILDNDTTSGNTRMILYYGTNNIHLFANGNEVVTGTLGTNTWYHLVVIHTATTYSLYLNGTLQGSTQAGTLSYPYNFFFLTNGGPSGGVASNVSVDEVGLWSRVLTPTEITNLYHSGTALAYPFQGTTLATADPLAPTELSVDYDTLPTYTPTALPTTPYPYATSTATSSINLLTAATTAVMGGSNGQ